MRKCVVIAHGVHETGRREVIGHDVGEAETEAFWRDFLRSLVARGLLGVQLVVSDAHPGLKAAIAEVIGCAWRRCSVHFLGDLLGHARKDQAPMLAALVRPIFGAPDREAARAQLSEAVAALEGRLPKVAAMLEAAEEDVLAFFAFPAAHRRKTRSTDESVKASTRRLGRISGDRSVAGRSCSASDHLLWRRFGREPAERADFRGRRSHVERSTQVQRVAVGVRLRSGRGRPPSEEQGVGL